MDERVHTHDDAGAIAVCGCGAAAVAGGGGGGRRAVAVDPAIKDRNLKRLRRIEGQVDGEIAAQDVLTVGEGAMVNAKIAGTTIIIEGQVTGDVTARQRL